MTPTRSQTTVAACWAECPSGTDCLVFRWPSADDPQVQTDAAAGAQLILVNDLELVRSRRLLSQRELTRALDFRELFVLAEPLTTAEEIGQMLAELGLESAADGANPAQDLVRAWPALEKRFRAWPDGMSALILQLLNAAEAPWQALAEVIARFVPFELAAELPSVAGVISSLIEGSVERLSRRELPEGGAYIPLDADLVAAWLEPGGACARLLEGYEYRAGQVQLTRAVVEAFNTGRHLAAEAGTGVGKSVGYLLPAILWARQNEVPVIVSTNTKNLQTQLFHKDIPLLRNVLSQPFRAAMIKGRMNYVCLRHLIRMVGQPESELNETELPVMARVLAWLAQTTSGDLEELDRLVPRASSGLLLRLPATAEECGGRSCRHYSRCFLQRARARSLNADIVVANHSLVFAESHSLPVALPRHAQVIFDEAHHLEDSATRFFTREISSLRFFVALRRLWRASRQRRNSGILEDLRAQLHGNVAAMPGEVLDAAFEDVESAIKATEKLRRHAGSFLVSLGALPQAAEAPLRLRAGDFDSPRWAEPRQQLDQLRQALDELCVTLEQLLRRFPQPDAAPELPGALADALRDGQASLQALAELRLDLDFITAAADAEYVYWLNIQQRDRERMGVLSAAPIDISERLVKELFEVRDSVILCSATLSVDNSFNFLAGRIGLDRLEKDRLLTLQAVSPFDFANQCRVVVPAFLPDPGEHAAGGYTAALTRMLLELVQRTGGRTLVLFTSYEMLRNCAAALEEPLRSAGITLLAQGLHGSRDRLIRTFRRDVSSVLLGTDSFWEGVDVVGESLSCVVIARLPFDAVGDPLIVARGEHVAARGGSPFRHYALPNAIIKFRQGFGRLIRHRSDQGLVIVADRRIQAKSYGLLFRRSLPCGIRTLREPDELWQTVDEVFSSGSQPHP